MNYIITTRCDKGCPYCFATTGRNKKYMSKFDYSLEQFKEYLDKNVEPSIKLLGGEPTSHPEFILFAEEALKRNKEITLISNFLFNDEIREYLVNKINHGAPFHFLVNSTDLDQFNRIEKWSKNYNEIYLALYNQGKEENISCGITFVDNISPEQYMKYLDFLLEHIYKIERLRLSISFPPGDKKKVANYAINNLELGEKFNKIIAYCLTKFIKPSLDCIIYPCMFENKEQFKIAKNFMDSTKFKCNEGKGGGPADLFPDGSVSYCYPLKEVIKLDFGDYKNSHEVGKALKAAYTLKEQEEIDNLPEACKACKFFKSNLCAGPCLGMRL